MSAILRTYTPLRTSTITISLLSRASTSITALTRRQYSYSDYGGEDQTRRRQAKLPRDSPTRRMEHPGPNPSPNAIKDSFTFKSPPAATSNAAEHAPGCCEAAEKPTHPSIPSNKAHPTLSDGRQSPNVDVRGNRAHNIPEDVQRHNAEIKERHDQSYNRISDRGDVIQGFRSGST
ncbi:hypothetical protein MPDQ_006360 [Monascus purpureus]|uniref:Uncharacterized protein n=1 Tax=Monascus purpureus TaxID=5098 RepID=A0A507QUI2_MONPU|nr:hypothetical protein MPDQ_006360 [Monascus purpureus]BDD56895.1 hypothetical protein MAP00_002310 [Monascus purpureus]